MAGSCGPVNCCRSFSRIFGAPQPGYSRFSRTIDASTVRGSRFAWRYGRRLRSVKRLHPAVLVAVEDLVAGLARDPELGAQRRHLLALEQAGDKPEPLVHDVTLLPRHAPSCEGAKCHPCAPEYGVTYVSGRTDWSFQRLGITASSPWGGRHAGSDSVPTNQPSASSGVGYNQRHDDSNEATVEWARRLFRPLNAGPVVAGHCQERSEVDGLLSQQERSPEAPDVGPVPGREARRCPRAGAGGAAQGCS